MMTLADHIDASLHNHSTAVDNEVSTRRVLQNSRNHPHLEMALVGNASGQFIFASSRDGFLGIHFVLEQMQTL